jgi:hypothetical protein
MLITGLENLQLFYVDFRPVEAGIETITDLSSEFVLPGEVIDETETVVVGHPENGRMPLGL